MVLGFFKHAFSYFTTKKKKRPRQWQRKKKHTQYVEEKKNTQHAEERKNTQLAEEKKNTQLAEEKKNTQHAELSMSGNMAPSGLVPVYRCEQGLSEVIGYVMKEEKVLTSQSTDRNVIKFESAKVISDKSAIDPTIATKSVLPAESSLSTKIVEEWDGWPDGNFQLDLSFKDFKDTGELMQHWASRSRGDRYGTSKAHAETWMDGKLLTKRCLGVVECDNRNCERVDRALTLPNAVAEQLSKECSCGSTQRHHVKCDCQSRLYAWSKGYHFEHDGYHQHRRPGRVLHILPKERRQFNDVVRQNPTVKPLALVTGVPGVDGPGKSVADITPALLNTDRVAKERDKVKKINENGGDKFIKAFAEFDRKFPGFVVGSKIGFITVISFQTELMESLLVKVTMLDEPVNGIVSDATHKWFKENGALLIISSVYSPDLRSWAPGLMSYSNGQTSEHFRYHFKALFRSIARAASRLYIPVNDKLFSGVMDFSAAEKSGFIQAFVDFWSDLNDGRSEVTLNDAVEAILKGCQEHYRANVIRVSKITKVVDPDKADVFCARLLALLHLDGPEQFRKDAISIKRDFPDVEPWISWWTRPDRAAMLFATERSMDMQLWDLLPATTNAEEAMHFRFYSAAGRYHLLMEGLNALWSLADLFKRRYTAVMKGAPIIYGQPERWKGTASKTGTTHPERVAQQVEAKIEKHAKRQQALAKASSIASKRPKYINDGRGPDTIVKLMQASKKRKRLSTAGKKETKQRKLNNNMTLSSPSSDITDNAVMRTPTPESETSIPAKAVQTLASIPRRITPVLGPPSYPWNQNSCWLDSSLQIIFTSFESYGFTDFLLVFSKLPEQSSLLRLYTALSSRLNLKQNMVKTQIRMALKEQRNELRRYLKDVKIINQTNGFQPLLSWLFELVNKDISKGDDVYFRPSLFFKFLLLDIQRCTGSSALHGSHVQITHKPRFSDSGIQIGEYAHKKYDGCISSFVADLFATANSSNGSEGMTTCWRTQAGSDTTEHSCPGIRTCSNNIIVSIPVLMFFEVASDLSSDPFDEQWDFPGTLNISGIYEEQHAAEDVIYDLAGFVLLTANRQHFIARYCSKDKKTIYTYDGLQNMGQPVIEPNATFLTHMACGEFISLPPQSTVYQAFYHLRGGTATQDKFYECRTAQLALSHQLIFSTPTLAPFTVEYNDSTMRAMPSRHRTWLSNPSKARTTEYVDRALVPVGTGSPVLKPSKTLSDEEELSDNNSDISIPLMSQLTNSIQEPLSQPHSLPDEDFRIQCRCGLSGDGNILYNQEDGLVVACDACGDWSHIACQRDGRADNLGVKDAFQCDVCLVVPWINAIREKPQRKSRKKISARLLVGNGALARHGSFWYPVRLIQRPTDVEGGPLLWKVRWWRTCVFELNIIEPNSVTDVPEEDIVDSLWRDQSARRMIRLGIWTLAINAPAVDAILDDPKSTPFPPFVDAALQQSTPLLERLMTEPETVHANQVPAKMWLEQEQKSLRDIVPFAGSMSFIERAQVSNWFEVKVAKGDDRQRHLWMTGLPLAHAYTLFIAYRMSHSGSDRGQEQITEESIRTAWRAQSSSLGKPLKIDVDREAVMYLEEEMFEHSQLSGPAGNWQWGLDTGSHQGGWSPYADIPSHWSLGDRTNESDSELNHGPDFLRINVKKGPELKKAISRPRPRPVPSSQVHINV